MNIAPLDIIWASLPVPAVILTKDDLIDDINAAAELFFNASLKAMRGTHILDALAVTSPLEEGIARVRANQAAIFINDIDVTTGERAPVQCMLQIAPMQDDPTRLLVLINSRELADRMGRGASVRSAAKSAIGMAEMLAHEIKNPLAGISGAAQLLSMGLSPEDQELTQLIVDETRRIVKLLEQVEQFGNTSPPQRQEVNVHDILDRARRSAIVSFGRHMKFIEAYDPSLPLAYADPDQLQQVFLNLVKNASEAADPAGGTIQLRSFYDHGLRLRKPDGTGGAVPLTFEVIDNGPGIPEHIASDVFEPFVSGRTNGTGLGLALVSKIISDNDGWIAVESAPGRTVFRISLPMAPKNKGTL